MIRERLEPEGIILTRVIPSRKCTVTPKGHSLSLRHFGKLLGFKNHEQSITADVATEFPYPVDILQGLRYIRISCDMINPFESSDELGNKSSLLACLAVVSYEPLNSSVTEYQDINKTVLTTSGTITNMRFNIDSNIDADPEVDARYDIRAKVLMNIVVE